MTPTPPTPLPLYTPLLLYPSTPLLPYPLTPPPPPPSPPRAATTR